MHITYNYIQQFKHNLFKWITLHRTSSFEVCTKLESFSNTAFVMRWISFLDFFHFNSSRVIFTLPEQTIDKYLKNTFYYLLYLHFKTILTIYYVIIITLPVETINKYLKNIFYYLLYLHIKRIPTIYLVIIITLPEHTIDKYV